ncbi:hypothetical protein BGW38_002014 [Lunasporangiospora selenospora]|uniref:Uncharacterized protein n=1 Tax=Lunasporangiospora selenospora TaxID=979761 RepID=A0A9P6KD61_9FUNG|nr:hypothetical protein BGW38_002014 [Lunasporangiospora selenospora]
MARVDVRAYTFRKKARHYVAVKPQSALRIEPIIYLKTSILNEFEEALQNWDYLRLPLHRFRDQAIPKKKLNAEGLGKKGPPILHVLPKNFKLTPSGEPVIDIRRGHVIICIKLSCYSDHHAEPGGFVIRMQANPPAEQQLQPHRQSLAELESGRTNPAAAVQAGDSVQIRICCEARTKSSLSGTGTASSADGPSQKKKRVRRKNLKASAEAISQQIQVKDPGPSTVKSDQSPYGGDQDEYEQEEGDDEGGRSSRASKRTGTGSVRRGSATRPGSRMTNGDDDDEGGEEEEEEEEGDEEEETVVDIDAVIVPTQRYPFSQPSAQVYYPPRP